MPDLQVLLMSNWHPTTAEQAHNHRDRAGRSWLIHRSPLLKCIPNFGARGSRRTATGRPWSKSSPQLHRFFSKLSQCAAEQILELSTDPRLRDGRHCWEDFTGTLTRMQKVSTQAFPGSDRSTVRIFCKDFLNSELTRQAGPPTTDCRGRKCSRLRPSGAPKGRKPSMLQGSTTARQRPHGQAWRGALPHDVARTV